MKAGCKMKVYKRKANDPAPLAQADPYMIKGEDGRYYMYAIEYALEFCVYD